MIRLAKVAPVCSWCQQKSKDFWIRSSITVPKTLQPIPMPEWAVKTQTQRIRTSDCGLEAETSGTVTDLLDFRICHIGESEQEIRGRLFVLDRDVAIAFQPAVGAADDGRRRIVAVVGVAVAHAASKVDQ